MHPIRLSCALFILASLVGCAGSHTRTCSHEQDDVFVVDISGSMQWVWDPLLDAILDHARALEGNHRLALVVVGLQLSPHYGVVYDDVQLTTFPAFYDRLTYFWEPYGTYVEPTLDAVHAIGTGALELGFREGADRNIIVFTDEASGGVRTNEEACASLTHGERLTVFTSVVDSFDACGTVIELVPDQAFIENALQGTSCD